MSSVFSVPGLSAERHPQSRAIVFVHAEQYADWLTAQPDTTRHWLTGQMFQGRAGQFALLPDTQGRYDRVLAVIGGDTPYAIAHLLGVRPGKTEG